MRVAVPLVSKIFMEKKRKTFDSLVYVEKKVKGIFLFKF